MDSSHFQQWKAGRGGEQDQKSGAKPAISDERPVGSLAERSRSVYVQGILLQINPGHRIYEQAVVKREAGLRIGMIPSIYSASPPGRAI